MSQGFVQMPKAVLKSPKLTMQAKQIYLQLTDYAWAEDYCFPGRERLALENGTHVNTVDKYIKELKDFGLITIERPGKKLNNVYWIENLDEEMIKKLDPYFGDKEEEEEVEPPPPEEPPSPEEPPKDGEPEPPKKPKKKAPKEEPPKGERTVYERIIEYLNKETNGFHKPNTKTTVKFIDAILKEGYTTRDFKMVIDFKTKQWLHDPEQCEYLRPSTLFRLSRFEEYIAAARAEAAKKTVVPMGRKQGDDYLNQYYGS